MSCWQPPARWLAAGLGDTLAKWYEFRAVSTRHPARTGNALSSLAHSQICYEVITEHGPAAYAAVLRGESGTSLDRVLDAIFTGRSDLADEQWRPRRAAHAIYEGFTFCDKTREFGHGLLVGYGNLCLLALEDRSDEELVDEMRGARLRRTVDAGRDCRAG